MTFFNSNVPIFKPKHSTFKTGINEKLLHIEIKIQNKVLFSCVYTCIDQSLIVWGLISAAIFLTAQFVPLDWGTQALIWSVISLVGTILMIILTYNWVKQEGLRWLLYCWAILMGLGVIITDSGVFLGWGWVLRNLSHLWLGLSLVGYLLTGLGMRSRAFIIAALFHGLGLLILPFVLGWQFLATGLIMVLNLLIFAQTQWDDYGCQ